MREKGAGSGTFFYPSIRMKKKDEEKRIVICLRFLYNTLL